MCLLLLQAQFLIKEKGNSTKISLESTAHPLPIAVDPSSAKAGPLLTEKLTQPWERHTERLACANTSVSANLMRSYPMTKTQFSTACFGPFAFSHFIILLLAWTGVRPLDSDTSNCGCESPLHLLSTEQSWPSHMLVLSLSFPIEKETTPPIFYCCLSFHIISS